MNVLDNLRATAGQRTHENSYGARLRIFYDELPCTAAGIVNDFTIMEGGRALKNFVEQITFRKDLLTGPYPPAKEVFISLLPANATTWIDLKLGMGGLLADGLTYKFMAYDRNFAA